ncbi:hypothetical protein [Pelagicoccus sp. SDUM812002]|uniref:hypothetical protein n=1 Tax=Pelagicoccus sp. SDUM812002 TaxID=3041266 RepID=UPI00280E7FA6|nr:hypothetical protein [Pelagicoccus sp. SDUM812002]MDQ8185714.1 hypothetical protein [Pelagicoccus sp. SDUM812002]
MPRLHVKRLFPLFTLPVALALVGALHAGEPHTSPARWSGSRLFHIGPPPADIANRVRLQIHERAEAAGSATFTPRNPDTSVEGPWNATVSILLENDRALELHLENVAGPVSPRNVSDSLVFVRVPLGRVAFSDLLIETRHGELVFHELLLDGQIAFEQYQEALAHPDFAKTFNHLDEPPYPPTNDTPEQSDRP